MHHNRDFNRILRSPSPPPLPSALLSTQMSFYQGFSPSQTSPLKVPSPLPLFWVSDTSRRRQRSECAELFFLHRWRIIRKKGLLPPASAKGRPPVQTFLSAWWSKKKINKISSLLRPFARARVFSFTFCCCWRFCCYFATTQTLGTHNALECGPSTSQPAARAFGRRRWTKNDLNPTRVLGEAGGTNFHE